MTSASEENGDFTIVFSVQVTRGSPTGPYPENRVDAQDTENPGRPVCSEFKVPGEPGNFRARTKLLWCFPAAFFLEKVLQLHQQR